MSNKVLGVLIAFFSVVIVVLGIMIASLLGNQPQQAKSVSEDVEVDANPVESTEQRSGEDQSDDVTNSSEVDQEPEQTSDWDEMKENIIGKSDKDFASKVKDKPTKVRNDKTGNWRKTSIAESLNIEEYALSYFNTYMDVEEVHFIINFNNNTTTWLNEVGGLLFVEVREHVEKEEHDASTLGSGTTLKSYTIYPDGDIQETD